MRKELLDTLDWRGIAYDLETDLIQPGLQCPPVVCGSVANQYGAKLLDRTEAREAFLAIAREYKQLVLIGANTPFDILCQVVEHERIGEDIWPDVLDMYDPGRTVVTGECDGRVYDVQVAEALHAIAKGHLGIDPRTGKKITNPETGRQGRYSLAAVVDLVLGRANAKANNAWRMSYALLRDVPIDEWPVEARTYPVDDVSNPREAALAQVGLLPNVGMHEWKTEVDNLAMPEVHCAQCGALPGQSAQCTSTWRRFNTHEISRQCYADLALKAGSAWGFQVDHEAVDQLEHDYDASHAGRLQPFIDAGIIRADGTQNESVTKKYVVQAYVQGVGQQLTACASCAGSGKVPSEKTQGRTKINCKDCDGCGFYLPPEVPRTETGCIGIGADVLVESASELLIDLADYDKDAKIKNDYIPFFRQRDKKTGEEFRNVPLTLRPNVLLENGRVSYDGKIMMLPRHGKVRGCLSARMGRLLSTQDYEGSELVAHAQSCLWIVGASRLAELLNKGLNAHLALARQILACTYDEAQVRYKSGEQLVIDIRQICKPGNFGFMGRMGAATMVKGQRKQNDVHTPHPNGPTWITVTDKHGKETLVRGFKGLRFCLFMHRADYCGTTKVTTWKGREYPPLCKACIEACEDLKKSWLVTYPENIPYFAHVKQVDESGLPVCQHVSKRLRGFRHGQVDADTGEPINSGNAIANTYFSAMIADAAKNALCAATRECYDKTHRVRSFTAYTSRYEGSQSPLYGSRIPSFQHDELIGDHPESVAAEGATRLAEIMEESLRIMCPDMHKAVKVQPTLIRRMDKRAQPVYDATNRLIPWEPNAA